MKTPICDFANAYAKSESLRLHMPGHKGNSFIGVEHLDLTEIDGADSLYEADGIIAESEGYASEIFGCKTYYSTEGSSQCIKAMMYLVALCAKKEGSTPLILAGRNAHKAFHSAIALLDIDVEWLYPKSAENYLSCNIDAEYLSTILQGMDKKPTALYLTTPDYLGDMVELNEIAKVCHKNGILLVVDNAHGAYLRFLPISKHPMDLGADMCCDSAHKTLPVLTGGAYLHLSKSIETDLYKSVKDALVLFGSTSPSYLILQSLDAVNVYLENYSSRLAGYVSKVEKLKSELEQNGYSLYGKEPLKITIEAKKYGYYGIEFAKILNEKGIVCEFADRDFVVLMLNEQISDDGLEKIRNILLCIEKKQEIYEKSPSFNKTKRAISIREARFSLFEELPIEECLNRIAYSQSVGCPPAVPIIVAGEIIDQNVLECFEYYNITTCKVVK